MHLTGWAAAGFASVNGMQKRPGLEGPFKDILERVKGLCTQAPIDPLFAL